MNRKLVAGIGVSALLLILVLALSGDFHGRSEPKEEISTPESQQITDVPQDSFSKATEEIQVLLQVYDVNLAGQWTPEQPEAKMETDPSCTAPENNRWIVHWEAANALGLDGIKENFTNIFANSDYTVSFPSESSLRVESTSGFQSILTWDRSNSTAVLDMSSSCFEDTGTREE